MSASRILVWIVQYRYDQILNCKLLCSIHKHKTLEFLLLRETVIVSEKAKSRYYTSVLSPIFFDHIFVVKNIN